MTIYLIKQKIVFVSFGRKILAELVDNKKSLYLKCSCIICAKNKEKLRTRILYNFKRFCK